MSAILPFLKAIWPFISEMIIAKRIKSFYTMRPLMAYSTFGGLIAFAGFIYMTVQATTCASNADAKIVADKANAAEMANVKRDNTTLRLSLRTALYELAAEQEMRRQQHPVVTPPQK